MKPTVHASRARQTIPAGSLKKQESSKKRLKNKLKSSNRS